MTHTRRSSLPHIATHGLLMLALLAAPELTQAARPTPASVTPAATLTYSPASLTQTLNLGQGVTHTLTLTATGAEAIDLYLSPYTTLLDRVYGAYATATDFHLAYFNQTRPETLNELSLLASGSPGGDFVGNDFSKLYAIAGNGNPFDSADDTLVTLNTTTGVSKTLGLLGDPPGFETYGAMAYDPLTAKLYAVSSYVDFFGTGGSTLYTVDLVTGQAAVLGPLTSANPRDIGALAFDDSGHLYALDQWGGELVQIDLDTLTFTAVGALNLALEFNAGMDWDTATQQMYLSTWRSVEGGELWTLDLTTGQPTLVGSLGSNVPGSTEIGFTWIAFAAAPAPWLNVTPPQVTVPANGTATVALTLDTRGLAQLGPYAAQVAFNGVFSNSVSALPIALQVTCATCGTIAGSFSDAWAHTPINARLQATSAAGMAIQLTPNLGYSITVPADTYTLTASAPGYWPTTTLVTVTTGSGLTTNFSLLPQASQIAADTTPIAVTANLGAVVTRTITVSNTGTVPMTFSARLDNLAVPLAVRNATLAALRGEAATPQTGLTIQGYGVNHPGFLPGGELGWFDLTDPTTLFSNGVYHDHGSFVGGDFWDEDYGTLYGFEESRLMALNTATGAKTYVGALPAISTYDSYNSMAYDRVTAAMYLVHQYDCFTPPATLYRVNVHTAAVTAMGELPNTLGCLGDLAFDDNGRLFAIDIDNNTLLRLDPLTAEATVIGALGIDIPTFEQGLAWDSATDQLYLTAVEPIGPPFIQKFYQVDPLTGHATFLSDLATTAPGVGEGYLAGLAMQADASEWVQLPDALTLPAGLSATVALVFDTRSLYRTGDYAADLTFSGSFINAAPAIPVALHLNCPTCATLQGTVTDAETAAALPATLHLTGPAGFDVTLYNKTAYSLTVLPGTYSVDAFAPSHEPILVGTPVLTNSMTTIPFALRSTAARVSLDTQSLSGTVTLGERVTRTFALQNQGLSRFDFAVRTADLDAVPAQPTLDSCGAPDSFGYACIDSLAPGGPTYHWVDISATGTPLGLSGGNDYYGSIALPFTFNYYTGTYTQVVVSSYGQIYFEDRTADPSFAGNQTIPMPVEQNGVQTFIAPYWDSLNYDMPNNPQTYYAVQGVAPHRRLVIQWNNATANWSNAITFQTILFEDSGNILMQYATLNGDTGENATIGIQGTATVGLEYSYNTAALTDTLAICFVHPASANATCALEPPVAAWLTPTPLTGTVLAQTQQTITVVLDASALTLPGTYHAQIYVGGPTNAPLTIPVTFTVQAPVRKLYLPVIRR